jgi:Outer membrane protein beta-barrel domain
VSHLRLRLRRFAASTFAAAAGTVDKSAPRVLLVLSVLLIASPALAQSRFEIGAEATWTGGFDAGGLDALETRNPSTGTTPLTLFGTSSRVKPAPGAAVRGAFYLTPRLAVEGFAEYTRATLQTTIVSDFEAATGTEAENTIASYLFGGSVRYHFGAARLTPFVSAGAGWLRQLDEDRVTVVSGPELHAGGGVTYRLSPHFNLRVDAGVSSREKSIAFEEKRRTLPAVGASLVYRF